MTYKKIKKTYLFRLVAAYLSFALCFPPPFAIADPADYILPPEEGAGRTTSLNDQQQTEVSVPGEQVLEDMNNPLTPATSNTVPVLRYTGSETSFNYNGQEVMINSSSDRGTSAVRIGRIIGRSCASLEGNQFGNGCNLSFTSDSGSTTIQLYSHNTGDRPESIQGQGENFSFVTLNSALDPQGTAQVSMGGIQVTSFRLAYQDDSRVVASVSFMNGSRELLRLAVTDQAAAAPAPANTPSAEEKEEEEIPEENPVVPPVNPPAEETTPPADQENPRDTTIPPEPEQPPAQPVQPAEEPAPVLPPVIAEPAVMIPGEFDYNRQNPPQLTAFLQQNNLSIQRAQNGEKQPLNDIQLSGSCAPAGTPSRISNSCYLNFSGNQDGRQIEMGSILLAAENAMPASVLPLANGTGFCTYCSSWDTTGYKYFFRDHEVTQINLEWFPNGKLSKISFEIENLASIDEIEEQEASFLTLNVPPPIPPVTVAAVPWVIMTTTVGSEFAPSGLILANGFSPAKVQIFQGASSDGSNQLVFLSDPADSNAAYYGFTLPYLPSRNRFQKMTRDQFSAFDYYDLGVSTGTVRTEPAGFLFQRNDNEPPVPVTSIDQTFDSFGQIASIVFHGADGPLLVVSVPPLPLDATSGQQSMDFFRDNELTLSHPTRGTWTVSQARLTGNCSGNNSTPDSHRPECGVAFSTVAERSPNAPANSGITFKLSIPATPTTPARDGEEAFSIVDISSSMGVMNANDGSSALFGNNYPYAPVQTARVKYDGNAIKSIEFLGASNQVLFTFDFPSGSSNPIASRGEMLPPVMVVATQDPRSMYQRNFHTSSLTLTPGGGASISPAQISYHEFSQENAANQSSGTTPVAGVLSFYSGHPDNPDTPVYFMNVPALQPFQLNQDISLPAMLSGGILDPLNPFAVTRSTFTINGSIARTMTVTGNLYGQITGFLFKDVRGNLLLQVDLPEAVSNELDVQLPGDTQTVDLLDEDFSLGAEERWHEERQAAIAIVQQDVDDYWYESNPAPRFTEILQNLLLNGVLPPQDIVDRSMDRNDNPQIAQARARYLANLPEDQRAALTDYFQLLDQFDRIVIINIPSLRTDERANLSPADAAASLSENDMNAISSLSSVTTTNQPAIDLLRNLEQQKQTLMNSMMTQWLQALQTPALIPGLAAALQTYRTNIANLAESQNRAYDDVAARLTSVIGTLLASPAPTGDSLTLQSRLSYSLRNSFLTQILNDFNAARFSIEGLARVGNNALGHDSSSYLNLLNQTQTKILAIIQQAQHLGVPFNQTDSAMLLTLTAQIQAFLPPSYNQPAEASPATYTLTGSDGVQRTGQLRMADYPDGRPRAVNFMVPGMGGVFQSTDNTYTHNWNQKGEGYEEITNATTGFSTITSFDPSTTWTSQSGTYRPTPQQARLLAAGQAVTSAAAMITTGGLVPPVPSVQPVFLIRERTNRDRTVDSNFVYEGNQLTGFQRLYPDGKREKWVIETFHGAQVPYAQEVTFPDGKIVRKHLVVINDQINVEDLFTMYPGSGNKIELGLASLLRIVNARDRLTLARKIASFLDQPQYARNWFINGDALEPKFAGMGQATYDQMNASAKASVFVEPLAQWFMDLSEEVIRMGRSLDGVIINPQGQMTALLRDPNFNSKMVLIPARFQRIDHALGNAFNTDDWMLPQAYNNFHLSADDEIYKDCTGKCGTAEATYGNPYRDRNLPFPGVHYIYKTSGMRYSRSGRIAPVDNASGIGTRYTPVLYTETRDSAGFVYEQDSQRRQLLSWRSTGRDEGRPVVQYVDGSSYLARFTAPVTWLFARSAELYHTAMVVVQVAPYYLPIVETVAATNPLYGMLVQDGDGGMNNPNYLLYAQSRALKAVWLPGGRGGLNEAEQRALAQAVHDSDIPEKVRSRLNWLRSTDPRTIQILDGFIIQQRMTRGLSAREQTAPVTEADRGRMLVNWTIGNVEAIMAESSSGALSAMHGTMSIVANFTEAVAEALPAILLLHFVGLVAGAARLPAAVSSAAGGTTLVPRVSYVGNTVATANYAFQGYMLTGMVASLPSTISHFIEALKSGDFTAISQAAAHLGNDVLNFGAMGLGFLRRGSSASHDGFVNDALNPAAFRVADALNGYRQGTTARLLGLRARLIARGERLQEANQQARPGEIAQPAENTQVRPVDSNQLPVERGPAITRAQAVGGAALALLGMGAGGGSLAAALIGIIGLPVLGAGMAYWLMTRSSRNRPHTPIEAGSDGFLVDAPPEGPVRNMTVDPGQTAQVGARRNRLIEVNQGGQVVMYIETLPGSSGGANLLRPNLSVIRTVTAAELNAGVGAHSTPSGPSLRISRPQGSGQYQITAQAGFPAANLVATAQIPGGRSTAPADFFQGRRYSYSEAGNPNVKYRLEAGIDGQWRVTKLRRANSNSNTAWEADTSSGNYTVEGDPFSAQGARVVQQGTLAEPFRFSITQPSGSASAAPQIVVRGTPGARIRVNLGEPFLYRAEAGGQTVTVELTAGGKVKIKGRELTPAEQTAFAGDGLVQDGLHFQLILVEEGGVPVTRLVIRNLTNNAVRIYSDVVPALVDGRGAAGAVTGDPIIAPRPRAQTWRQWLWEFITNPFEPEPASESGTSGGTRPSSSTVPASTESVFRQFMNWFRRGTTAEEGLGDNGTSLPTRRTGTANPDLPAEFQNSDFSSRSGARRDINANETVTMHYLDGQPLTIEVDGKTYRLAINSQGTIAIAGTDVSRVTESGGGRFMIGDLTIDVFADVPARGGYVISMSRGNGTAPVQIRGLRGQARPVSAEPVVPQQPSAPQTARQLIESIANDPATETVVAQTLLDSTHAADILQQIPPGSTPLSARGNQSVVLRTPDGKVLRIGHLESGPRPAIDSVLQAESRRTFGEGTADAWQVEVLPLAETTGITAADVMTVETRLRQNGYTMSGDMATNNVGRYNGRLVVIDPGAVTPLQVPARAVARRFGPIAPEETISFPLQGGYRLRVGAAEVGDFAVPSMTVQLVDSGGNIVATQTIVGGTNLGNGIHVGRQALTNGPATTLLVPPEFAARAGIPDNFLNIRISEGTLNEGSLILQTITPMIAPTVLVPVMSSNSEPGENRTELVNAENGGELEDRNTVPVLYTEGEEGMNDELVEDDFAPEEDQLSDADFEDFMGWLEDWFNSDAEDAMNDLLAEADEIAEPTDADIAELSAWFEEWMNEWLDFEFSEDFFTEDDAEDNLSELADEITEPVSFTGETELSGDAVVENPETIPLQPETDFSAPPAMIIPDFSTQDFEMYFETGLTSASLQLIPLLPGDRTDSFVQVNLYQIDEDGEWWNELNADSAMTVPYTPGMAMEPLTISGLEPETVYGVKLIWQNDLADASKDDRNLFLFMTGNGSVRILDVSAPVSQTEEAENPGPDGGGTESPEPDLSPTANPSPTSTPLPPPNRILPNTGGLALFNSATGESFFEPNAWVDPLTGVMHLANGQWVAPDDDYHGTRFGYYQWGSTSAPAESPQPGTLESPGLNTEVIPSADSHEEVVNPELVPVTEPAPIPETLPEPLIEPVPEVTSQPEPVVVLPKPSGSPSPSVVEVVAAEEPVSVPEVFPEAPDISPEQEFVSFIEEPLDSEDIQISDRANMEEPEVVPTENQTVAESLPEDFVSLNENAEAAIGETAGSSADDIEETPIASEDDLLNTAQNAPRNNPPAPTRNQVALQLESAYAEFNTLQNAFNRELAANDALILRVEQALQGAGVNDPNRAALQTARESQAASRREIADFASRVSSLAVNDQNIGSMQAAIREIRGVMDQMNGDTGPVSPQGMPVPRGGSRRELIERNRNDLQRLLRRIQNPQALLDQDQNGEEPADAEISDFRMDALSESAAESLPVVHLEEGEENAVIRTEVVAPVPAEEVVIEQVNRILQYFRPEDRVRAEAILEERIGLNSHHNPVSIPSFRADAPGSEQAPVSQPFLPPVSDAAETPAPAVSADQGGNLTGTSLARLDVLRARIEGLLARSNGMLDLDLDIAMLMKLLDEIYGENALVENPASSTDETLENDAASESEESNSLEALVTEQDPVLLQNQNPSANNFPAGSASSSPADAGAGHS